MLLSVVRLFSIASTLVKQASKGLNTAVLFSVVRLFSIASTLVKQASKRQQPLQRFLM
jgi:hypothetical protein